MNNGSITKNSRTRSERSGCCARRVWTRALTTLESSLRREPRRTQPMGVCSTSRTMKLSRPKTL
eukprot:10789864-Prorocentrum_lima.AAC.1